MRKELDEALCRDFPNLYRDRHANMRMTAMCWGFPRSGWEPLIRELSKKLEALIIEGNWKGDAPRAAQVKEKYGTLRFYLTHGTDTMFDLIEKAEDESAFICEQCGEPAKTEESGGWLRTLCPAHSPRSKSQVKRIKTMRGIKDD